MIQLGRIDGEWEKLCPFFITSIVDDMEGLVISIEDGRTGQKGGKFRFDVYYGYRNFNESDRDFYWKGTGGEFRSGLYVADASEFMEWARERHITQQLDESINHYMIVSSEDVLEVLAFDPPSFFVAIDETQN